MARETKLNRVRTGPTSYLEFNDDDLKIWKDAGNKEYSETGAPAEEPAADDAEAKAEDKPAENKARKAPAEKKQG